jgi:ABC-type Mn2+/Zn2+ transport system ATPase subunit
MQAQFNLTIIMSSHDLQHIRHVADSLACISRTVHWHDRAELLTEQDLKNLYACELDAFLTHEHQYHEHGRCYEPDNCPEER